MLRPGIFSRKGRCVSVYLSRCFIRFVLYSVLGYIYETTFCTIVERKWQNRGFLFGPLCPIYGVGAVLASGVFDCPLLFSSGYSWWQVFLICVIGSALLEYVTSWVLEKLFHAYWWDYSNLPLNLHGRISLFTSLGFGVAGLLVVYILDPVFSWLVNLLPDAGAELVALLLMALLAADTAITVASLSDLRKQLSDVSARFDDRMSQIVDKTMEKIEGNIDTAKDNFIVQSVENLIAHMSRLQLTALRRVSGFHPKHYKELISEKLPEFIKNRINTGKKK